MEVYDRAGVLVTAPTKWRRTGAKFLDELDDTGQFSLDIQNDDPDIDDIEAGQIVVWVLDTVPIWRSVVRRRFTRQITPGRKLADQYTTLSGTGEVGRLDEIVVYPTGGLGRFPYSDDVSFNWTHPSYDDSAWQFAVETPANYGTATENYGLPEGFPWGDAEWIWSEDSSGSVPGGIKYMRKAANVATAGVYEAWSAADDRNEVFISGAQVLKSSDAPYDGRTTAVELYITAGWVQIAAQVENRNDLKAGLLAGIGQPLDDSATPVVVTDDTWLVAPDGARLGMNAGQVMNILLDEFEARGGVAPARTWTSLLDSNEEPWETYEEVTTQVMTTTALDVLRQMVELEMCDFRMSADAFELNLYNPGTAGTLVDYTLGDTNLASLTYDETPAVSTALLLRWGRGYTDVENAGAVTEYGRRESGLALGGVNRESTAETQGAQVVSQFGRPRAEIAATIEPEDVAHEPYTLYFPGSYLKAPTPGSVAGFGAGLFGDGVFGDNSAEDVSGHRVMAIGMGLDDTGNPKWDVHLNSTIAEQEKRQQLALKRLAANVGGRSQNTTIPYEPRPIQPREPDPIQFSQDGGITIRESGRHTFTRGVRIVEVRADIDPTSSSGDVVVVAKKNGTTFATVTIAAGRQESYTTVDNIVFRQRIDVLTVETTSIGTGVESITVNVVYI